MSLLLATQITAVATAVLGVGAIITAIFAFLAFRKQSVEVTTLQDQISDQRKVNEQQTTVLKLQTNELGDPVRGLRRRGGGREPVPWLRGLR
ncbi:MAG TPA: hypothetical protein VNF47_04545 [Streptosporangiaceae bacterium]|nr:hypothetical protein [Streptosporangiaceae bacterium]